MFSRTERCSSDGSCVTMPICRRSESWVTRAHVLAVDADRAALGVEEAQQQVDERRLAGAGAADQPDLLARPDGQRDVAQAARRRGRSGG